MFKFYVNSEDFANVIKKIAIAIPTATKGGNDGIKMVFYKTVRATNKSMGIFLAYDGKVQAVSPLVIEDVTADKEEIEIHVSGKKILAAAMAYATLDAVLEFSIDKELTISGSGSKITLQLVQKIVALQPQEEIVQEIEMKSEEFFNFMNFASSSYGENAGSRGLHCVGIRIDEEKKIMTAISSNGSRCAYAETEDIRFCPVKEGNEKHSKEIIITIEGKILKNVIRNLARSKKVVIGIDLKRIRIKSGSDVVMILTQDIAFPMDSVIKIVNQHEKVGAWKSKISDIFQSLGIHEVTMEDPWLQLSKQGDSKMCMRGKDTKSSTSFATAQEGEIETVVISEKEFKNTLLVFAKESEIIVETISHKSPITIRQTEEDPNRIIIFPIVDEE